MPATAAATDAIIRVAVTDEAWRLLRAAPVTPAYRAALIAALRLPGNVLSTAPDARWARLVWTCCAAAGGDEGQAVRVAAAVELFMVALDVLDDAEDGEETALQVELGAACALNVSTGLLFLAQRALLDAGGGAAPAVLLLDAGLHACGGQHADLTATGDWGWTLGDALAVTAGKLSIQRVSAPSRRPESAPSKTGIGRRAACGLGWGGHVDRRVRPPCIRRGVRHQSSHLSKVTSSQSC